MSNLLVSIIVPVFNSEKYLEKCVESLLNQNVENYEIILVDDGSNDKSGEICDELALKDDRIKVIHKENGGSSSARNAGLKIASGRFIVFCDSDDWVENNYLESLVSPMINKKIDLSVIGLKKIYEDFKVVEIKYDCNSHIILPKKDFYKMRKAGILYFPVNKCFKKEIIDKYGLLFDDVTNPGCEDLCFCLSYLQHIENDILISEKTPYFYFQRSSSRTQRYIPERFVNGRQRYFNEFEKTFNSTGLPDREDLEDFYTYYFNGFIECLKNTFDKRNKNSFIKKLIQNHRVVASDEFKKCYERMDKSQYSKPYLFVCRLRCASLILIFLKICK